MLSVSYNPSRFTTSPSDTPSLDFQSPFYWAYIQKKVELCHFHPRSPTQCTCVYVRPPVDSNVSFQLTTASANRKTFSTSTS